MKRNEYLNKLRSWLGKNEGDGSHREIIDIYNSHRPLPRGYAVKYTDDWCATTVSAAAIDIGCPDDIPLECSAPKMMDMFKAKGKLTMARTGYIPVPGDVCFFDWNYNNVANHVAVVEEVKNNCVITIDGNFRNYKVDYRTTLLNDGVILAYGHPNYNEESGVKPTPTPEHEDYSLTEFIKDVQRSFGAYVDGIAGNQTLNKTKTISRWKNDHHKVVKYLQKRFYALGYKQIGKADGVTGPSFYNAVVAYQRDNGLYQDGEVTAKGATWKCLLGMTKKNEHMNNKPVTGYSQEQFVRDIQGVFGAHVDGIAGSETLNKTKTISQYENRTHPSVKYIQKRLKALGYTKVGTADGVAGSNFTKAMIEFQRDNGCYPDGEVTAKNKTWRRLLGMG